MRKVLLIFCLVFISTAISFAQWNDNRVVEHNRHYPRAHFMSYSLIENALSKEYNSSRNFISLNGKWKFKQYNTAADISLNITENTSSYEDINIPATWESLGLENCQVGVYRSAIEIPVLWSDKDVFMVISQGSSASNVYINGYQIGFLQDSEGVAEYNISKYLNVGVNNIAIVVYRKSDGALLDNASSKTGISGDCYIFAQPKTRINNFEISSDLDNTLRHGKLDVAIEISNSYNSDENLLVGYDILDSKGDIVTYNNREVTIKANSVDTVTMSNILSDVRVWSSENPNLYTLFFRVKRDGRFIEFFTYEIGFRSVNVEGKQILINGKPILIKGVNYNDIPRTKLGNIDANRMKKDLSILKQHGVNTIYTSTQSPILYSLCDSYGLYVCSEINLHPQTQNNPIQNNPAFKNAFISRTQSVYHNLRNYPSVIMWSLGDSKINGYNFYKAYQYLDSVDNKRPVVFAGASMEVNTDIISIKAEKLSDIVSITKTDNDRIMLLNDSKSISNISTVWDIVKKTPSLQGGFIADFVAENGIVNNNRDVTQRAKELQTIFGSVNFSDEDLDRGKFKITNNSNFEDLSSYDIIYNIIKGKTEVVAKGNIKGVVPPNGGTKVYQIPVKVYVPLSDKTPYYVRFIIKTKETTPAYPKGTIIYSTDLRVPNKR